MISICKQNTTSAECKQWMSDIFAHCNRLLANKHLELWNEWWLNKQPVPHYHIPHLMSAYDCKNLMKEMENDDNPSIPVIQRFDIEDMDLGWRIVLVVLVVCLALCIIGPMVWLLNRTLRRIALPNFKDCERQGYGSGSPRSFISFGKPFQPQTRFGPYRKKKIVVPHGAYRASKQ
ncbi:uncharacterized protein LOC6568029 [Drosophila grimshawi]|uniref:GH15598 n=1 Tax=Drosophila grimshawi TaxID=7222 RepID=B4JUK7_DROGR|nr:uncharacterized protein LOC6568029 [Drosophila grimshawi]EDV91177.1 GH15598 [Drosophila grimshawi]